MTSASLKVTVNGRKFQVSGITKKTSCKDLLCALAKVTIANEKCCAENSEGTSQEGSVVAVEGICITSQAAPYVACSESKAGSSNGRQEDGISLNKANQASNCGEPEVDSMPADNSAVRKPSNHEPCDTHNNRANNGVSDTQNKRGEFSQSNTGGKSVSPEASTSQVVIRRSREHTGDKKRTRSKRLSVNFDPGNNDTQKEELKQLKRRRHRSWTFAFDEENEDFLKGNKFEELLVLSSENVSSVTNTEKSRNTSITPGNKIIKESITHEHKTDEKRLRDHLRIVLREKSLEIQEIPVQSSHRSKKKTNKSKGSKKGGKLAKKTVQAVDGTVPSSSNLTSTRNIEGVPLESQKGVNFKHMHPTLNKDTNLNNYDGLQDFSSHTKEIKSLMKEMKRAEFLEELRKSSPTYIIDKEIPKEKGGNDKLEAEIENDNDSGVQTVEYDSSQEIEASPTELTNKEDEESGICSTRTSPEVSQHRGETSLLSAAEKEGALKHEWLINQERDVVNNSTTSGNDIVTGMSNEAKKLKRRGITSFDDLCLPKEKNFSDSVPPLIDVCSVAASLEQHKKQEVQRRSSLRKTGNCLDLTRAATSRKDTSISNGKFSNDSSVLRVGNNLLERCSCSSSQGGEVHDCLHCTKRTELDDTSAFSDSGNRRKISIPRSESLTELSLASVASDDTSNCSDERSETSELDRQIALGLIDHTDVSIWHEMYYHAKQWYDYRQMMKSLMDLLDELLYKELLSVHLAAKLDASDNHTAEADDRLIAMEEMAIAKDLMGLKNLIRSVTQLTKYQRREMAEVYEEIDFVDWEINKRTIEFESLEVKLASFRTKGAPRALVKRKKGGQLGLRDGEGEENNTVSLV